MLLIALVVIVLAAYIISPKGRAGLNYQYEWD